MLNVDVLAEILGVLVYFMVAMDFLSLDVFIDGVGAVLDLASIVQIWTWMFLMVLLVDLEVFEPYIGGFCFDDVSDVQWWAVVLWSFMSLDIDDQLMELFVAL